MTVIRDHQFESLATLNWKPEFIRATAELNRNFGLEGSYKGRIFTAWKDTVLLDSPHKKFVPVLALSLQQLVIDILALLQAAFKLVASDWNQAGLKNLAMRSVNIVTDAAIFCASPLVFVAPFIVEGVIECHYGDVSLPFLRKKLSDDDKVESNLDDEIPLREEIDEERRSSEEIIEGGETSGEDTHLDGSTIVIHDSQDTSQSE